MKVNVAVLEEQGRWVAQALEHNVRVEGANSAEVVYRIKEKLEALYVLKELCDLPPAPQWYWEWASLTLSL